ncbi:MAG: metal-dependent hydrolase [Hyphomicrobiales bacterium]
MKTPSHALLGLLTAKAFGLTRTHAFACVLGACLADLPLLTAYVYFLLSCFWETGHYDASYIEALMDGVYFQQSWLLMAHSVFHSPVSIAYLALVCLIFCPRDAAMRNLILAYLLGSFTHSLLDIISHVGDGPLLLWPLNDDLRVIGLFSHYLMGAPLYVEMAALLFFVWAYVRRRVDSV